MFKNNVYLEEPEDHAEVWLRGATPRPRSGAASERSYPTSEYIMRNAGLEEAQAGTKIARRNINNLRYADDTTLMAESEEELKSLLMKMKVESEKVDLSSTFRKLRSWHLVPSLHGK